MAYISDPGPVMGKYCPECIIVYVGLTATQFKYCPKCGLKICDVKVVKLA